MTAQSREIYQTSNGDKWSLVRGPDGQVRVKHEPNLASGGQSSEMDIADFLGQAGAGPEKQELRRLIGTLVEQNEFLEGTRKNHERDDPVRNRRSPMSNIDKQRVVSILNGILEQEIAGVVRYTHYSFLVYGYSRIPIVSWLREQADESLVHAQQAGEMITHLGEYPSLGIGPLLDSYRHDIGAILRESLEAEGKALQLYQELLEEVEGKSVMIEEYARQMIHAEELHAGEVDKMLRRSGDVAAFDKNEPA